MGAWRAALSAAFGFGMLMAGLRSGLTAPIDAGLVEEVTGSATASGAGGARASG